MEEVTTEEENIVILDDYSGGGSGGSDGGDIVEEPSLLPLRNKISEPKPCPPKFLVKTFEIVEDPLTNSIISWSPSGTSLIVWDIFKFSKLLPKYFKHNNFSSFIYQLNNYGFRKISWEQWEYQNQWFQAGQKHLLFNIKRRNKKGCGTERSKKSKKCSLDSRMFGTKGKLEILRNDKKKLEMEIQALKLKQENTENQLVAFQERITEMERKQQKMIIFIANKSNPAFLGQFIQEMNLKPDLGSIQATKKRRFVVPQSTETLIEPNHAVDTTPARQNVNVEKPVHVVFAPIQTELTAMVSAYDSGNPIPNEKANATFGTSILDINSENDPFFKNLLENNSLHGEMFENEEEMAQALSKIVMEMENSISPDSNE